MKTKIFIGILVLSSITLLSLFNMRYSHSYKENVLYSQKDVDEYSEKQSESSNLVNRNEAIRIARYYIEDILGNEIDIDNSKMYVNLYKNDENAESYYWNISWFRSNLSCGIEINTINKEINSIYVNKLDSKNNTQSSSLTRNDILDMVRYFISVLGFDLNSYKLSTHDVNYNNEPYKVCTFTNKNDKKNKFVICISIRGNYIARYNRNVSKEIF